MISVERGRRAWCFITGLGTCFWLAFGLSLLVRSPMLGVADNGDSWRVRDAAGLGMIEDSQASVRRYVVRQYRLQPLQPVALQSSASLVAVVARGISQCWRPGSEFFDLRFLGALYWLLATTLFAAALLRGVSPFQTWVLAWVRLLLRTLFRLGADFPVRCLPACDRFARKRGWRIPGVWTVLLRYQCG
jgi:hypothetical protein